jgi:hypothetical protein
MSPTRSRIEENVATSRALGQGMKRSAATVVGALDRASRSSGRSRSAKTGRYVTVSGKTRTLR